MKRRNSNWLSLADRLIIRAQVLQTFEEERARSCMPRSSIVGIGCTLLGAVAALEAGTADSSDASSIAYSANLAAMLAELGLGEEYADEIAQGLEAGALLVSQARSGEPMATDLPALKRLTEIHLAQLESDACTWTLIEEAKDRMQARIAAGETIEVEKAA